MGETNVKRTPRTKPWLIRHAAQLKFWGVWLSFFALAFLFRSFLTLIFLTFVLTYTIHSLIARTTVRVTWPRWTVVAFVYILLVTIVSGMGMIVFPKVYQEGKMLSQEIPEAKDKLLHHIRILLADPDFSRFAEGMGLEETIKEQAALLVEWTTNLLKVLFRLSFHLLLSLIFSFLIIWDFDRLKASVASLRETRVKLFMEILGPKIVQFSDVVGRAFEAQIMVAIMNTLLTLLGMTILGVPSMLFLSVVVFVCSFIPVVGVFLSSLPICLLAFKKGSFALVFPCVLLIVFIHLVEAYILNPQIVGSHFSVHPFVAVCILVTGEYWFGVWGLLLGVPVAVFLFRSVLTTDSQEHPALDPVVEPKKVTEGA